MARHRRPYIVVLPSLLTSGNLFCGFYSIVSSFYLQLDKAAYLIGLAAVFDMLDGRVARLTRTQSRFGCEYDSLTDLVSFGLAPAFLALSWSLRPFGRLGMAASFFFVACAALRLARFTALADTEPSPKSYFLGLPSPAAAGLVAAFRLAAPDLGILRPGWFLLIGVFSLGLLMVSNVRYRSFKDFEMKRQQRFFLLVTLVGLIAFVVIRPELAIFVLLSYYVLWGMVREGLSALRRVGGRRLPGTHIGEQQT